MSNYVIPGETLTDIADSIRRKRDIATEITPEDMALQVSLIDGGGGSGGLEPFYTEEFTIASDFTSTTASNIIDLPNAANALCSRFETGGNFNNNTDGNLSLLMFKFEALDAPKTANEFRSKYILTHFNWSGANFLYFSNFNKGNGSTAGNPITTYAYKDFDQYGVRLVSSQPTLRISGRVSTSYLSKIPAGRYRLSIYDLTNGG